MTNPRDVTMASDSTDDWGKLLVEERSNPSCGAYTVFVAVSSDELTRHVQSRLGPDSLIVSDAVQEAYIQVYLKLDQFDDSQPGRPWVYTVFRNKTEDVRRIEDRHTRRQTSLKELGGVDEETGESKSLDPVDPNSPLEEWINNEAIRHAVARLPPDERKVVVLYCWGGHTLEKIGQMLGKSASSVRRILQHALAQLRDWLGS